MQSSEWPAVILGRKDTQPSQELFNAAILIHPEKTGIRLINKQLLTTGRVRHVTFLSNTQYSAAETDSTEKLITLSAGHLALQTTQK